MSLSELNPEQYSAVKYISGPCLVIAGAGSGKTKVITEKILYLLNECSLKSSEICAVTFTNKAAKEMRSRVAQIASLSATKGIMITTFHSLGLHILKREYEKVGLKRNFILMDQTDQRNLVSSLLKELQQDGNQATDDLINLTLNTISYAKMNGLSPDEYMATSNKGEEIQALLYGRYENLMQAYSAVDFDDLVLKPMKLLRENENTRKYWQKKFLHILVDEYQDTNETQYEFLKLLIGQRQKFTFVGDDDQSIYAWRGANPQNINKLQQDFPDLKVIKLEQNYRSLGCILHVANVLIANNSHIITKQLYSAYQYGDPVIVHESRSPELEANYICAEINAQRFLKRLQWRDFGILYRTNFQSREIEKAFRENHVPYRINGDISFFDRSEVKDIMAYYRILKNPNDDNALIRIINVPHREIGNVTTEKLGNFAKEKKISLYEAIEHYELSNYLPERAISALQDFKDFIDGQRENIEQGNEIEVISDLFSNIGYMDYLLKESPTEKVAHIKYENISQLKDWLMQKIKGNEIKNEDPMNFDDAVVALGLREMLDQNTDEENQDLNQVQLMTIHSAKGLEFNFVFIIGCEEKILPHANSIESGDIEEERRLMYVGITRAKRHLVLSFCASRQQEPSKITRFINELPQEDLKMETISKMKEIDSKANLEQLNEIIAQFKKNAQ